MDKKSVPGLNKNKLYENNLLKKISLYSFIVFVIFLILDVFRIGFISNTAPLWISLPLIISLLTCIFSFPIWMIIWLHSKKLIWKIIRIVGILVASLIVIVILWASLFRYAIVDGFSMEPLYVHDDTYLVNKFIYKINPPKRGDVIDYISSNSERMGRIVGLPNETLQIAPGELVVNGNSLSEPYADWIQWAENRVQNVSLKDDEYLVLFDKRGGDIQVVKKQNIIGKFMFKLFSK